MNYQTLMSDNKFKSITIKELSACADPVIIHNTHNNPELIIDWLTFKDTIKVNLKNDTRGIDRIAYVITIHIAA